MRETGISPEELGKLLGVSGMTVRRWVEKPNDEPLPELYASAIRNAVFKLVVEGRIDSDSRCVREVFLDPGDLMQRAAATALGFPENLAANFQDHQDQILSGLAHVGSLSSRRDQVDRNKHKLPLYRRMGREWGERITILSRVIASKKMAPLDKFLAYGALFYLFMSFDLIPDTIPVFGFMDDFSVLGFAASYYVTRKNNG